MSKTKSAKPFTLNDFMKRFPDDAACLDHLMALRYGHTLTCTKCSKTGRFSRLVSELAYSCPWCGHHIHPMVGTPFARTHVPLFKWFYAIYLFTTTRHGVPAKELQRQLGVSYPTALRMSHEIRKYMAKVDGDPSLGGHVEVDETYVGGHTKGGTGGRNAMEKVAVFGMIERGGDLMARVVPDASAKTLMGIISKKVEKAPSLAATNGNPTLGLRRPDMITARSTTAEKFG